MFIADSRVQESGQHPLSRAAPAAAAPALGPAGVLLGLLGVPNLECKPVGLLDKLRAQNSLREDLSHCQPGPVSEEVS